MTETFKLSNGTEVDLPLVTDEALACFMAFRAKVKLLPELPESLEHISFLGTTMCALLLVDYRAMSIGPYCEMVVMAPVKYRGSGRPPVRRGVFVHEIAVTTELSKATGREVWGFPKYLADIRINQSSRTITAFMESERTSFEASIPGRGFPMPAGAPLPVFTVKQGRVILSYIKMKGIFSFALPGMARISLGGDETTLAFLGKTKRALAAGFMKVSKATLGPAVYEETQ